MALRPRRLALVLHAWVTPKLVMVKATACGVLLLGLYGGGCHRGVGNASRVWAASLP